jgi:hypothetical protein
MTSISESSNDKYRQLVFTGIRNTIAQGEFKILNRTGR